MSETKHTPGPWRNCEPASNFGKGKRFIRPSGAETLIATVSGEMRSAEREANARLIAAAPDLLRELKHLVGLLAPWEAEEGYGKLPPGLATLNGARTAIAKAEGR